MLFLAIPNVWYCAAAEGTWEDDNDSESADDGETVSYTATVKNEGTVTLRALVVTDTSGSITCDPPASGLLKQDEEYQCEASRQVDAIGNAAAHYLRCHTKA